ncbi:hypothetical protein MTO96_049580 [Rhipicephalus appendiculatus]
MYSVIPPPPFLQCPGVPPIPWKKWRRVLQVYIDAAAPDATPERKKVLLLNALGVEELHTYYKAADEQTQLDGDQANGDGAARDAYQLALAVMDAYFAPPEEAVCMRAKFRRRVQQPDETAVQFIQALRRLADNCSFGTAAAALLHVRKFFKGGNRTAIKLWPKEDCNSRQRKRVLTKLQSIP